jgi:putative tryptophan/tyrosine transport system substrate-binding protein
MASHIERRKFLVALGGAAAAWPLAAEAQQPAIPVIGFLHPGPADDLSAQQSIGAFGQGLSETGYVDGRNVSIERRWANNHYERLPALAAELVQRQVAVIVVAGSTAAALAAKAATKMIPIVFNIGSDPVDVGLVDSLSRPGANITGVSNLFFALTAKRLELLHDLVPTASVIALLVNPTNQYTEPETREAQAAARTLGLHLDVVNAVNEIDVDEAFATLVQRRAGALLVGADPVFTIMRDRLVALAAQHKVPASYAYRDYAAIGGLTSYGTSRSDSNRQVGIYTGRILKGEKPADLPVQQPSKFELIINLKTARALGLHVPTSILLRADEVIE